MNHCEFCRHGGNCDKEWRYSKLTYPCERYDKVQTNEEWFCGLSTEEKAEFLFHVRYDSQTPWKGSSIFEWLKQPHNE